MPVCHACLPTCLRRLCLSSTLPVGPCQKLPPACLPARPSVLFLRLFCSSVCSVPPSVLFLRLFCSSVCSVPPLCSVPPPVLFLRLFCSSVCSVPPSVLFLRLFCSTACSDSPFVMFLRLFLFLLLCLFLYLVCLCVCFGEVTEVTELMYLANFRLFSTNGNRNSELCGNRKFAETINNR
jgi:hypothetical protein